MNTYGKIIFLIVLTALAGCGSSVNRNVPAIIGVWEGIDPNGAKMTFTFRPNNTVSLVIVGKETINCTGKYIIKTSKNPMWIDLYEFDHESLKGGAFRGLIAFENENFLRLEGSFGNKKRARGRPSSFSDSSYKLSRVQ